MFKFFKKDTEEQDKPKTSEQRELEVKLKQPLIDFLRDTGYDGNTEIPVDKLLLEISKNFNNKDFKFKKGYQQLVKYNNLKPTDTMDGILFYTWYIANNDQMISHFYSQEVLDEMFENKKRNYQNNERREKNFNEDYILKEVLKDIKHYRDSNGYYDFDSIYEKINEVYFNNFHNTKKVPSFSKIKNMIIKYCGYSSELEMLENSYYDNQDKKYVFKDKQIDEVEIDGGLQELDFNNMEEENGF